MSYARELKFLNGQLTVIPFTFTTTGATVSVKTSFGSARKFKVVGIAANTHGVSPATATSFWVTTTGGCDANGVYTANADGTIVVNRGTATDSGLTGTVTIVTA